MGLYIVERVGESVRRGVEVIRICRINGNQDLNNVMEIFPDISVKYQAVKSLETSDFNFKEYCVGPW